MLAPLVVANTADAGVGSLRAAVAAADNTQGKDEIVFDVSLFAGGTPVINLSSPISVQDPVTIHSPNGQVAIVNGSSAEEAFFLRPQLSGIGEDFEIRDLVFQDFTYGIRINDAGGTADPAYVEGVKIIGDVFLNNERGIYFDRALVPFEIAGNQILGRGDGASPGDPTDAGIWIGPSTSTNSFAASIHDNPGIGDHEDYGIIVLGARIPNLSITGNRIGQDATQALAPNGLGIYIQGAEMQNGVIAGNNIVYNGDGIVVLFTDGIDIYENLIALNVDSGIELLSEANDHQIEGNGFIGNGGAAIEIGNGASDQSVRNRLSENYFLGNNGLPIDLGSNGLIEPNDPDDIDGGPNRLLNYPEILEGQIEDEGTRWRVPVQFDTLSSGEYRFEFYRYIPACRCVPRR